MITLTGLEIDYFCFSEFLIIVFTLNLVVSIISLFILIRYAEVIYLLVFSSFWLYLAIANAARAQHILLFY